MDKSVIYFKLLILLIIIISCNGQEKSKLTIINCTNHNIDSLNIGNILNSKAEKLYNLKSKDSINRVYSYDLLNLPKGDHIVFGLTVFFKDYFFHQTNGYIGFPFSKVESHYEFFIYDYGVVTIKGLIPKYKLTKHNLSEIKTGIIEPPPTLFDAK